MIKIYKYWKIRNTENFEYLIELLVNTTLRLMYTRRKSKKDLALKSKNKKQILIFCNTSNENIIDILNNNLFYISTSLLKEIQNCS